MYIGVRFHNIGLIYSCADLSRAGVFVSYCRVDTLLIFFIF